MWDDSMWFNTILIVLILIGLLVPVLLIIQGLRNKLVIKARQSFIFLIISMALIILISIIKSNIISFFYLSFIILIIWFQGNGITTTGIYSFAGTVKWHKISGYRWLKMKTINNQEYEVLRVIQHNKVMNDLTFKSELKPEIEFILKEHHLNEITS